MRRWQQEECSRERSKMWGCQIDNERDHQRWLWYELSLFFVSFFCDLRCDMSSFLPAHDWHTIPDCLSPLIPFFKQDTLTSSSVIFSITFSLPPPSPFHILSRLLIWLCLSHRSDISERMDFSFPLLSKDIEVMRFIVISQRQTGTRVRWQGECLVSSHTHSH